MLDCQYLDNEGSKAFQDDTGKNKKLFIYFTSMFLAIKTNQRKEEFKNS